MTGKVRVYEVAKQLGIPNKELIGKIKSLGITINNHMSTLDNAQAETVLKAFGSGGSMPASTSGAGTVVRRRKQGAAGSGVVVRRRKKAIVVDDTPAESKESVVVKEATPTTEVATASAPPADVVTPSISEPAEVAAEVAAEKVKTIIVEDVQISPAPPPAPEVVPEKVKAEPAKPLVLTGPAVVDLPGLKPVNPLSSTPRVRKVEPIVRQKAEDVGKTARSRFEEELERARSRAEATAVEKAEKAEKAAKETEEVKPDASAEGNSGRPQVGTVINLPNQRIRIAERKKITAKQNLRNRYQRPNKRPVRRGKHRKGQQTGGGKQTQITTPAEHKRVIRMEETIAISELAKSMGIKASEVLKKLWGMGMVGVNINATIDHDTAQLLASEFGYEVQNVAFQESTAFEKEDDKPEDLETRAPVVTIMGHVDHGKTSLLDKIRTAKVASGESGGITQHVAAYKVDAGDKYGDIVFMDTPGHEAFTEMRARGAQATDIVVLVVAANDGVMPQTVEALNHAKDAKVQIIVAVNKCDLPEAQPEVARQQLAEHGLIPEEWGGDTMYLDVSAKTGEGIDKLLESITLTAEVAELKANAEKSALGLVIEAKLDRNRGPMASILIQEGTLRKGDVVVAGNYYGKVRAMLNDRGEQVEVAGPSTPVELLGLDGVPLAGEQVNVADDEKTAKIVVEHRRLSTRRRELASSSKVSLENLMERIKEGASLELKVVLKADVQGSSEALKQSLVKQSTDKVSVNVISAGVGGITESDVNLAKAGGAIIIGFHVRPAGKAAQVAEREDVEIKLYNVIYEAVEDVRDAMAGLLAPIRREVEAGAAEVRDTFTIPRRGVVAGCMVTHGTISRKAHLRVVRDSVQIFEGKIDSLKRFKDDAAEVSHGYECGIMIAGFNDLTVGDVIEAYDIVEERAQL